MATMCLRVGGIFAGIDQQLSPPAMIIGDAYSQEIQRLPDNWKEALVALESSQFAHDVLGVFGGWGGIIFFLMKMKQEARRYIRRWPACSIVWPISQRYLLPGLIASDAL